MADLQYVDRKVVTQASISVKVPVEQKQRFCEILSKEGSTPNQFLKKIIIEKINGAEDNPLEDFRLEYSAQKDNFSWVGVRENGTDVILEPLAELSVQEAEKLLNLFTMAMKTRKNYIDNKRPVAFEYIAKGIRKLGKR